MNPLSFAQLEKLLTKWSYKPGFSFYLYSHPYEGTRLAIVVKVTDAYAPEAEQEQCVRASVPPMFDSNQFFEWLLWRVIRFEIHEACEFARVEDRVFRDPHGELYADSGFNPKPASSWFNVPPGMEVHIMTPNQARDLEGGDDAGAAVV